MKITDLILQRWRIAKVRPFLRPGLRILDVGSSDGALFQQLGSTIGSGMGIDPRVKAGATSNGWPLVTGYFPKDMPDVESFDVITMLAVLEHFPAVEHPALREGCLKFLRPGGLLLITVPSALVDNILAVLHFLRLIDGTSLEEHHGYEVSQTPNVFPREHFRLLRHKSFQLGLNNLFVFERNECKKS